MNTLMMETFGEQLDGEEINFIRCTTTADFAERAHAFCEKMQAYLGWLTLVPAQSRLSRFDDWYVAFNFKKQFYFS